jgi:polyhydroxybutyrate depolymerase
MVGSGRAVWAVVATVALGALGCSGGDDDTAPAGASGSATTEAAVSAAVPSAGCDGAATPAADLTETTLDHGGVTRRFLLSAPAWEEGDDPLPLVVDIHGLGEGADIHAEMTQLGPLGQEEGFVTVFPHGTGQLPSWNVNPDLQANPDLAFVAAVLDRVEAERCIDTSRVYATGLSNGAMMTSAVACTMADRFAAVAPIAGILLPELCQPARPVPILTVHGTADPLLLFNGGIDSAALSAALSGGSDEAPTTTAQPVDLDGEGYPATVRGWATLNGCEDTAEDERVSDEVLRRRFDCPDEAPVEFLIVEGGGHSWPSSEFSRSIERIVGPTTFDIDASQEIWDFVSQFQLPDD